MYFAHGLWLLYATMDGSQILKYLLSDSQQKKFADPIAWAPGYKGLIPKGSHFEDTDKNKNHSVSGLYLNHKGIYHT